MQQIRIVVSGHFPLRFPLKRSAFDVETKGLGRELNPGPPLVDGVEFPVIVFF